MSPKSAISLSCLSIIMSVCPASNVEQAIARVGHHEAAAAACRDCRANVKAYATARTHAATCRYEQFWHEELVWLI